MAVKLTKAEQSIIDWMRDGDRALYKCPFDSSKYGHGPINEWTKIATRKQVESLIAKGLIEWFACHPSDLRAMLVQR